MLLIDDHTRFSWFYLLKSKDEAYSSFMHFKQMVQTQFGKQIKMVQSDWGREF